MQIRHTAFATGAFAFGLLASLAACGGGGSGGGGDGSPPVQATTPPGNSAQVVKVALPTTAIGTILTAYGVVGGYTQTGTSQTLGFAPGQQIMIENAQNPNSGIKHTLGDTTGTSSFPTSPPLSMQSNTANGGTFGAGFQTGTIQPGSMRGPFTLQQGTYFIGCAYHYSSYTMRDVLVVAPNATPGPSATPPPGQTSPPYSGGGGY